MSENLERRVDQLERAVRILSGSLQGIALLMAARVGSYRAFDEPVAYGLSPWHGTWEATCARFMLDQLDEFLPADPSTPEAEGLARVRELLVTAIHQTDEPNERALRATLD